MSQELEIRFWWDDAKASLHMQQMLAAFEGWIGRRVQWTRAHMQRGEPANEGLSLNSPFSTTQFYDWIVDDLTQCKVLIQGAIPCWRFRNGVAEPATVPVTFAFWGRDFGQSAGLDQSIEGNAQFCIFEGNPYLAPTDDKPDHPLHGPILENLEVLFTLLRHLTVECQPSKWLAFADAHAAHLPIHAQAGWFARPGMLLSTLQDLRKVLQDGRRPKNLLQRVHQLPPIAALESLQGTGYRHTMRSPDQNADLLRRLRQAALPNQMLSLMQAERGLQGSPDACIAQGQGAYILQNPWYWNGFLDGPLLQLLGATQA
jgi:hypothetical protein